MADLRRKYVDGFLSRFVGRGVVPHLRDPKKIQGGN
jgi:hypothetical protein